MERYLKGDIGIKKLTQKCQSTIVIFKSGMILCQKHAVEVSSTAQGSYTGKFKVSVVEYIHNIGKYIRKTAAHFNILSRLFPKGYASNMNKEKSLCLKEQRGWKSKMETKLPRNPKINIETN